MLLTGTYLNVSLVAIFLLFVGIWIFKQDMHQIPSEDKCLSGEARCGINGMCVESADSYICVCNPGYSGNGKNCDDIDECASNGTLCHKQAKCLNSDGSYKCKCDPGFSGSGKDCKDIDECATNLHKCSDNSNCSNSHGSYICLCISGFISIGGKCTEVPNDWRLHGRTYFKLTENIVTHAKAYDACEKLFPPASRLFAPKKWSENDFILAEVTEYLNDDNNFKTHHVDREVGTSGNSIVIGTKEYFKGKEKNFTKIDYQVMSLILNDLGFETIVSGDPDEFNGVCMIRT